MAAGPVAAERDRLEVKDGSKPPLEPPTTKFHSSGLGQVPVVTTHDGVDGVPAPGVGCGVAPAALRYRRVGTAARLV